MFHINVIYTLYFQAYDQPDIYETSDVTEQETSDYYEEEPENESIDRLHISTKDSFNKFKGKYLTGYVDFSDKIGRKIRTGYDARFVDFNLLKFNEFFTLKTFKLDLANGNYHPKVKKKHRCNVVVVFNAKWTNLCKILWQFKQIMLCRRTKKMHMKLLEL